MMVTGEPCGVATGGTVCTRRELTPLSTTLTGRRSRHGGNWLPDMLNGGASSA
jgi:hypothetical protein